MSQPTFAGRPYQRRMTEACIQGDVLLAAPPGLGKTASVLEALDSLIFDYVAARQVLVVAPKIVAYDTWPNEIRKWANFQRLTYRVWEAEDFGFHVQEVEVAGVVTGQKMRPSDREGLRARILADRSKIHLVSHDNFFHLAVALGKDHWCYDILVVDESGGFAVHGSHRYEAAKAAVLHVKRRILMNGTPVGNKLEKLWGQMCLVDGGEALGTTLAGFRLRWMKPEKVDRKTRKVHSWLPEEGAVEQIVAASRGRLVTLLEKDWLTLPPMVIKEVGVEIPMDQYRKMARELYLELAPDAAALAVNAGVLYNKLSQLACGIVFDQAGAWHEIHRVKIEALLEIVDEHDGPLLIWTSFAPDMDRIQAVLPGAVRADKVKDLERRWNAGELRYLLAHPKSLAYGANLQDCPGSGMCWFGVTGNAEFWNQGIKRLHRSGRKEPVVNYAIVARGTVEERMLALRAQRTALEEDVMDALAFRPG